MKIFRNLKRKELANSLSGAADYVTQPVLMLMAAPFLLHRLGAAQYGVWVLASATVRSGELVSGGFEDAALKYVSEYRERKDWEGIRQIVRNLLGINLALGSAIALLLWLLVPYLVHHIARLDSALQLACMRALYIGCLLLVVKSVESVFINTVRSFQRYGSAARITIFVRAAILVAAVLCALAGYGVVEIMFATLLLTIVGVLMQAVALRRQIGEFILLPSWHRETVKKIAGFGCFSWLQGTVGFFSTQLDRIVIGFFLGAPAVAYYGICVQAAQPIHGIISSGFHFLFPHLSARSSAAPMSSLRHTIAVAFWINLGLVVLLTMPFLFFSKYMLTVWMGQSFAQKNWITLSIVAASFGLLAANVTAYFALLAAGRAKLVSLINLTAVVVMLLTMVMLVPKFGMHGAALARLVYGPITWITYFYLYKMVWCGKQQPMHERPLLAAFENR